MENNKDKYISKYNKDIIWVLNIRIDFLQREFFEIIEGLSKRVFRLDESEKLVNELVEITKKIKHYEEVLSIIKEIKNNG